MDPLAQEILAALRIGSVPAVGLRELAVGRDSEMRELDELIEYVARGKSALKFVSGNFGTGKSFFCAMIKERAFERGFAASTIVISPQSPLSKIDVIVGKTFEGLRLPEKRRACALSDVLERWLLNVVKKVASFEGLELDNEKSLNEVMKLVPPKIVEELSTVRGLDSSFVNAIEAYMQGRIRRDSDLVSDALGWLKGTTNLAAARRQRVGVRGSLSPLVALNFVKGLLHILETCGFKGLLWIIDEIETIQRLPTEHKRRESYESLRVLVDQIAESSFPGLLLVLTGTPRLLEDRRCGIPWYEPLDRRIKHIAFPDGSSSMRQPVITLRGFGKEDLQEIAVKVRGIHSRAYGWDAEARLPDQYLTNLVEVTINAFGGQVERTPGQFLRELVHLFDLLNEHPSLSADEYFRDDTALADRLNPSNLYSVVPRPPLDAQR